MNLGETGKQGEDLVARYLREKGCRVIKRNYCSRFGEIDIIAETDEYILFVEVKTRKEGAMVSPAEAVTAAKRRRITAAANMFLALYQTDLQPRFDVAQVVYHFDENGKCRVRLRYLKNAF
ncbi:MAG: YraN family protein [Clostridia bacterium]|nr:YraN family protein [Clostridia bacterium]